MIQRLPTTGPARVHPDIRDLIADHWDGDRYGTTMGALFGIAFVLYAVGEDIPADWQFRAGTNITTESIRE